MSIRNLDRIFKPRGVAVVGASEREGTVGFTLLRNLLEAGFPGAVHPVNPKHASVQGLPSVADVTQLSTVPDLAVVCTPARTVPEVVAQCGRVGVRGVIIVSAGFREAGGEGQALEQQVLDAARPYEGLRLVGPNCLGSIVPGARLNASFAASMPDPGHVAFISQSGALCTSVLDWAIEERIGFSYFVSIGNMLDVDFGDLIDYIGSDPETHAIILYVESITWARKFLSAARAFTRTKPIVAYKAGRFAESAHAAASHTGALAGEDAVYEAAFSRAGIVRVLETGDMFDCAELLAKGQLPMGNRLGIVTNAGGPGVMATDALMARRGVLGRLSEPTLAALDRLLPPYWSHGNPVDVLGDAPPERFAEATRLVQADPGVDAVLVILTPQAMTDPTATARSIAAIAVPGTRPILSAWMGGRLVREGIEVLNAAGLPTFSAPEHAVQAFAYLVSYVRNREVLYETPHEIGDAVVSDRSAVRARLRDAVAAGETMASEGLSKAVLEAYGFSVTRPYPAESVEQAVQAARRVGFPVVLKVDSPQISHKTDVGGVVLNLEDDAAVRRAFNDVVARARERRPDATVRGVTVQRMAASPTGFEMILGTKKDPTFGSAIMVGMGGVAAEVIRDRTLELPPLNERLARRMLESLRSWPLLQGYRGRPRANVDRLVETLVRFSRLVADVPEIQELDVNPLLVTPDDVVALDARVVLDPHAAASVKPFSHLAIRPYPEQFVATLRLADTTEVVLRPIRPEDEPGWHALLARCSPETLFQRFQGAFTRIHQMAARYCFIDYDREMAIVAEVEEPMGPAFVGVGRLVADPDHEVAEFAVLVADAWQGRGVGSLLTDRCLEVAGAWGIRRVDALIESENHRMHGIFERRGFEPSESPRDGAILFRRELG